MRWQRLQGLAICPSLSIGHIVNSPYDVLLSEWISALNNTDKGYHIDKDRIYRHNMARQHDHLLISERECTQQGTAYNNDVILRLFIESIDYRNTNCKRSTGTLF